MSTPAVSTNRVTLSETVLRHVSKTASCGTRAAAAPFRSLATLTAAYQSCPPMLTSMTPARSPNMKSGWPPSTRPSSAWPCHGIERGVTAVILKALSVMTSTWLRPIAPWRLVVSSRSWMAPGTVSEVVASELAS